MSFTAFRGVRCIATGDLAQVSLAIEAADPHAGDLLLFDDRTGRAVDVDPRTGQPAATGSPDAPMRPSRGRPKLGVVAREVTLLPRHWEWLAGQPGGASAALRRLVEDASRSSRGADRARAAQEAVHRVMTTLAGDLPGYEEALRSLYARDDARFDALVGAWPEDVAAYVRRLAQAERQART